MRKQNEHIYVRCMNNIDSIYYLYDNDRHYILKLGMNYTIMIYNLYLNKWFDTGFKVTKQANQTRSICRAWISYLRKIYNTPNSELCLNMDMMEEVTE